MTRLTYEDRQRLNRERSQKILDRLRLVTQGCRDDMHEPDEQDLKARVVGDHLDNAMGESFTLGVFRDYVMTQEFLVILERSGFPTEVFNLADLIALARRANLEEESTPEVTIQNNSGPVVSHSFVITQDGSDNQFRGQCACKWESGLTHRDTQGARTDFLDHFYSIFGVQP